MLKKKLGIEAIEKDWLRRNNVIKDYFKISSTLNIPEGVKRIGDWAFSGCEWLREVIMPPTLERIGGCSFYNCVKLEKLKVPESLKWVGYFAFEYCHEKLVVEEYAKEETGD